MARLVEAIRPEARLILVGDPAQLASIEAGAVLRDIVEPATDHLLIGAGARSALTQATGHEVAADDPPAGATVADGIVVLDRIHRFGGGIARLAEAIHRGDADTVLEVLAQAPEGVTWIPVDVADPSIQDALAPMRDGAIAAARTVIEASRASAVREAIDALGTFRLLCAHRRGPRAWPRGPPGSRAGSLARSTTSAPTRAGTRAAPARNRERPTRCGSTTTTPASSCRAPPTA